MQNYQRAFIEFALSRQILRFGDFTLKSGRKSPYFFNSGLFNTGDSLDRLGEYYAEAIVSAGLEFDLLFGPAYKGIPLACAAAITLSRIHGRSVPYCFDRKEVKDHGEGGSTVGAPLQGRVLIVDDVISAGTSISHVLDIIERHGANPAGVVIALDRQERGTGRLSAVQEVEQRHGFKVISVIKLDDLTRYLEEQPDMSGTLQQIRRYREQYGVG